MSDQTPPDAAKPDAAADSATVVVPDAPIPLQWVRDEDTPDPYLINIADFDAAKHTAIDVRGNAVKKKGK